MTISAPRINIPESDRIGSAPTIINTSYPAGFVGTFQKGPVNTPTLVNDESSLIRIFGPPNKYNQEDYLCLSEFLSYGGPCYVTRIVGGKNRNSQIEGSTLAQSPYRTRNSVLNQLNLYDGSDGRPDVIARSPGAWPNGLMFVLFDAGPQFVLTRFDDSNDKDLEQHNLNENTTGLTVNGNNVSIRYTQSVVNDTNTITMGTTVKTVDVWDYKNVGKGKYIWIWSNRNGATGAPDAPILAENETESIVWVDVSEDGNTADFQKFKLRKTSSFENNQHSLAEQYIPAQNVRVKYKDIGAFPSTTFSNRSNSYRNDEVNYAIIDVNRNMIVESGVGLSKIEDSIDLNGRNNYYVDVINDNSEYIYIAKPNKNSYQFNPKEVYSGEAYHFYDSEVEDIEFKDIADEVLSIDDSTAKVTNASMTTNRSSGQLIYLTPLNPNLVYGRILTGGVSDYTYNSEEITEGYNTLDDTVNYPLSFVITGAAIPSEEQTNQTKIQLLADKIRAGLALVNSREDAILLASPIEDMMKDTNDETTSSIIGFFGQFTRTSYAFFDSGLKRIRNRFTRKNVVIPCNGDIAGICRRTITEINAATSPAGILRGQFNKLTPQLVYNPTSSQRDRLYQSHINPVVRNATSAPYLLGDRTSLLGNSVFSDLSVRLFFIDMKNFISQLSTRVLFEKNNVDTREAFEIKFRGYMDVFANNDLIRRYEITVDETNNTPEVIDRGEFVADIYVQPYRSTNYVNVNLIASDSGTDFGETIGLVA